MNHIDEKLPMNHICEQPQFGENWFTYPNLYSHFARIVGDGGTIVEVGCWKGKSTAYLAVEIINSRKKIELHAVDTWNGSAEHINDPHIINGTLYDLFLTNIEPVISVVKPIRKKSVDAAMDYADGSLDVVFIDACHDYDSVKEDIAAWFPKVKPDGIISGHDYSTVWPGVVQAVNEFFSGKHMQYTEDCWVHQKP
jgi:SAM-dependent methyltransferase